MRQQINSGQVAYHPNSLGGGCPFQAKAMEGGFASYEERIDAKKIRARSQSFFDHFSQATLFYNSQGEAEKSHLTNALCFELSKVNTPAIRERMVGLLTQVDKTLAANVAAALGLKVPASPQMPMNHSVPADGNPKKFQPIKVTLPINSSAAISMENLKKDSIQTRQVAILAADGVDDRALATMINTLKSGGAEYKIIAPSLGHITGLSGKQILVGQSFLIATSVVFDAVYIAGGPDAVEALTGEAEALHFVEEAYKHCKPIAAETDAIAFLEMTYVGNKMEEPNYDAVADGVILGTTKGNLSKTFVAAMKQHRFWAREKKGKIPA